MTVPVGCGSWEGPGRDCLFLGWPRFGDCFMVPSGRCGLGGPSWHRAMGGEGGIGHSGEMPPSCCLARRGGWSPLVSMNPA